MVTTMLEVPKEFKSIGVIVDEFFDESENHPQDASTDTDFTLSRDRQDMARMGRKIELKRNFDMLSCLGFASLVSSTWELAMVACMYSLAIGGTAGTIWAYAISSIGTITVGLSLAEMASISPATGAQYHWVSEFAPRNIQRFLSYFTGWMAVTGWLANLTLVAYIAAVQIQIIVSLSVSGFHPPTWQAPLIAIGITVIAILCNTFLIRKMAFLEGACLMLHISGFMFVNVLLILLGPRQDVAPTLTTFGLVGESYTHLGLTCLVGLGVPLTTTLGADSSCYLAEEVRNASWAVPRAMIASTMANAITGLIITTNLVFNISNMYAAMNPTNILTYVTILLDATESRAATYYVVSLLTALFTACATNRATTASRQLYAFARDNGLPFSKWLSHVRPGSDLPLNSILAALLLSVVPTFIIVETDTAIQIISNIAVNGLVLSYFTAIVVFMYRKIRSPKSLPHATFSMGRIIGLVVNSFALIFLTLAFVFCFFPTGPDPTLLHMNWSVVVMGLVLVFCLLYWVLRARHNYIAPIERMRKDL